MTLLGKKDKKDTESIVLANLFLITKSMEDIKAELQQLVSVIKKQAEISSTLNVTLDRFLIVQNRVVLEEAKRRAAREEDLEMTKDDLRF
jgi:hypothetical protein